MRHKLAIASISGVCILLVIGIVWWRSLSRKYIIGWSSPFHARKQSSADGAGNICIVDSTNRSKVTECVVIPLFPNVYAAVGVDESRLVKWQDVNGFDSKGVDRSGQLLAPGYPIFSSLAWSLVEPAYLDGTALSRFLSEVNRAYAASEDMVAKANLRKLAEVATKAQSEGQTLRVG